MKKIWDRKKSPHPTLSPGTSIESCTQMSGYAPSEFSVRLLEATLVGSANYEVDTLLLHNFATHIW